MNLARPRSRARRWKVAVLVLSATLLAQAASFSGTAAAATGVREQTLYEWVNQARAGAGVNQLSLSERISEIADRHSRRMASSRTLYHSCLSCAFRGRHYNMLSENVAVAQSLSRAHELMMGSDSHRANILRGGFKRIGIGVVRRGGQVWVTQIFYG